LNGSDCVAGSAASVTEVATFGASSWAEVGTAFIAAPAALNRRAINPLNMRILSIAPSLQPKRVYDMGPGA